MSLFDGIKDAKVSKSGQWFEEGRYKVKIKAVKVQTSQMNAGKQMFIVETEVLESDCPTITPGMERSQIIKMGEVMTFPNIKAFIAAASGVDPNSENINDEVEAYWQKTIGEFTPFEKLVENIVSSANPLENLVMDLECKVITTKEEKKPFTKHFWQPRQD